MDSKSNNHLSVSSHFESSMSKATAYFLFGGVSLNLQKDEE